VIFSIFGRKESAARRRDSNSPKKRADSVGGPVTSTPATTLFDQREIARRTAEKIDLIESQMDLAASPEASASGRKLSPISAKQATASQILEDAGTATAEEVLHYALLPVLQEAAVVYSTGQSDEAAMILWQAIKEDHLGRHTRYAWAMLFDLYQASGRRPEFESLGIVYASRSESSPPAWSDELAPSAASPNSSLAASTIVFPVRLGADAVKQVEQMQRAAVRGRAAAADFGKVVSVDAVGAGLLLNVLVDFRLNARQLTLSGLNALAVALSSSIESGRRDPSDACWLLKLETLRFLGMQQQFEDLAIDYCMTYEVSPPSWEALPPSVRLQGPAVKPAREATAAGHIGSPDGVFALAGEIDGRPEAVFKALREYANAHEDVVIDCRGLRRIDFAGAGEILNEAAALRGAGKSVAFRNLSCLVGCLMMVMGIQEKAELNLRIR